MPVFSVVIPLYNKEKYISETIKSVLSQTFEDFECIVVDDGSTDKSVEAVESFKDSRIVLIKKENGGVSSARNRGIKEAKGEYIAFLDADDLWMPEKLEKTLCFFKKYEDACWGISSFIWKNEDVNKNINLEGGIIENVFFQLYNGLRICTDVIVIKREVFDKHGEKFLFDENYKRSEDRELWYRIGIYYPSPFYINETLALYKECDKESLTKTAYGENDTSFIYLYERLEDDIVHGDETTKKYSVMEINNFIKKNILNYWKNKGTAVFKNKDLFKHINKKVFFVIYFTAFLPKLVRKIISRIILLF